LPGCPGKVIAISGVKPPWHRR